MQPTAEMRREHRHRGRSAAVSGRKPNPVIQTKAIINAIFPPKTGFWNVQKLTLTVEEKAQRRRQYQVVRDE